MNTIRPNWNEKMHSAFINLIAADVDSWLGEENSAGIEDAIEMCKKAIKTHNRYDNGYELAKKLEREYLGKTPDAELVEILEGAYSHADDIEKKFVEAWVRENNITIPHSVGDLVSFIDNRNKRIEGEVMQLYPLTAKVGVWFDGIGHEKGKGHRVLNAEDVARIEQKAHASAATDDAQ